MSPNNCDTCGNDRNMCSCPKAVVEQVGGSHYKSEYQHWDWCIDLELGYLESAATKYVSRWPKKGGIQDVEKAVSYLEKARHAHGDNRLVNNSRMYVSHPFMFKLSTEKFCEINEITGLERDFMYAVASWKNSHDLTLAINIATIIINDHQKRLAEAGGGSAVTLFDTPQKPSPDVSGAVDGMANPFGFDQYWDGSDD